MRSSGQDRVINSAYGSERIGSDGSRVSGKLTEAQIREEFGPTLASLPGKPASFMLYFLEGKDELTAESKVELDKVFSELKRRPLPDIVVIGHTDTVGNLPYNDRLSLARPELLLVEPGVSAVAADQFMMRTGFD